MCCDPHCPPRALNRAPLPSPPQAEKVVNGVPVSRQRLVEQRRSAITRDKGYTHRSEVDTLTQKYKNEAKVRRRAGGGAGGRAAQGARAAGAATRANSRRE